MPRWSPEKVWDGADAVIIGGGDSLRDFPWEILKGESTIGCNAAYTLGKDICSVVLFGDNAFFKKNQAGLQKYGGPVFTNSRRLQGSTISWLYSVPRQSDGLGLQSLGWNGNTGASALNLALLFGASRVFLLGFDMCAVEERANWHDMYEKDRKQRHNSVKKAEAGHPYPRFLRGFEAVVRDWKEKFSDREIINVNDDTNSSG